jgi:hypothetical protein
MDGHLGLPRRVGYATALAGLALLAGCSSSSPVSPVEDRPRQLIVSEAALTPETLPASVSNAPTEPRAQGGLSKPEPRHSPKPGAPAPAAPVEIPEIQVKSNSLTGYWIVIGPAWGEFTLSPLSGAELHYSTLTHAKDICLLDDKKGDLTAQCVASGFGRGLGERDEEGVRVKWWSGPATVLFKGLPQPDDTITGRFSAGLMGVSMTEGMPVTLRRLPIDPARFARQPSEDVLAAALADYDTGKRTAEIYEPDAEIAPAPAARAPAADRKLEFIGKIGRMLYDKDIEIVEDVYRVKADEASEFCRIALSEARKVRDLECRRFEM